MDHEALIFLHIPKTAGTTLNRIIEWQYALKAGGLKPRWKSQLAEGTAPGVQSQLMIKTFFDKYLKK
jgi:hypothetical protein